MAWTTPGTATAGEVLTAAFWNTNVRDNSNMLRNTTGIVPPSVFVYNTGGKTVTSGTAFAWDAELYDTDTMFTSGVSTSRLTCKTAGVYMASASVIIGVTSTTCTNHEFGIYLNGNPVVQERSTASVVNGEYIIHSVSFMRTLAVNDYLECSCTFSGGSLNRINDGRNWFSATMLGATS